MNPTQLPEPPRRDNFASIAVLIIVISLLAAIFAVLVTSLMFGR